MHDNAEMVFFINVNKNNRTSTNRSGVNVNVNTHFSKKKKSCTQCEKFANNDYASFWKICSKPPLPVLLHQTPTL